MKKIVIVLVVILLAAAGTYAYIRFTAEKTDTTDNQNTATTTPGVINGGAVQEDKTKTAIGVSADKHLITAYHFGTGTTTELLFVGGIHGGYSWNTALVAYELMDYLEKNPSAVPSGVRVTVIPVLNPDGLFTVVGTTTRFTKEDVSSSQSVRVSGRFNGNEVDLNRNFDCDWKATGTWQSRSVSGGTSAFSEPESLALKNYIEAATPDAVLVWYSAAGGVFASSCHNNVSAGTRAIMNAFASASGYPANENFDFYAITGDLTNWLAKQNIPAISVLLSTHEDTEWNKNKAGIDALLKHFAN